MFSFKQYLSVYDLVKEDMTALQQQSQQLQTQINDHNSKMQRLIQQKALIDKQLQQQSQQQQQQNQNGGQNAAAATATTPGQAPAAGGQMAQPTVQ